MRNFTNGHNKRSQKPVFQFSELNGGRKYHLKELIMSASFHLYFIVYFVCEDQCIHGGYAWTQDLSLLSIWALEAVLGSPCPASVYPHHDFICSVEVLQPGRF